MACCAKKTNAMQAGLAGCAVREMVTYDIQHGTPLFMEHFEDTGSGSLTMMNGGSSKNVILIWNFSGTPCGGTCNLI